MGGREWAVERCESFRGWVQGGALDEKEDLAYCTGKLESLGIVHPSTTSISREVLACVYETLWRQDLGFPIQGATTSAPSCHHRVTGTSVELQSPRNTAEI